MFIDNGSRRERKSNRALRLRSNLIGRKPQVVAAEELRTISTYAATATTPSQILYCNGLCDIFRRG